MKQSWLSARFECPNWTKIVCTDFNTIGINMNLILKQLFSLNFSYIVMSKNQFPSLIVIIFPLQALRKWCNYQLNILKYFLVFKWAKSKFSKLWIANNAEIFSRYKPFRIFICPHVSYSLVSELLNSTKMNDSHWNWTNHVFIAANIPTR